MERLIYASKIYDAVEQRYSVSSGVEHRCERDLLDLICAADDIDPVHAAGACYCRECEHSTITTGYNGYGRFCTIWGREFQPVKDNDFCSLGKKKAGE